MVQLVDVGNHQLIIVVTNHLMPHHRNNLAGTTHTPIVGVDTVVPTISLAGIDLITT